MPLALSLAFIFLSASFLSLWIKRDPKIWASFFCLSMLSGLISGNIFWIGLILTLGLLLLWIFYDKKPNVFLFILLICISTAWKMKIFPGFHPFFFTPKFAIGLESSLIGLFPLAFLVPLSQNKKDWKAVIKGLFFGLIGIAILTIFAIISKTAHWSLKIPTFMLIRILSNLILTSIPEEGFYRGFVQKKLCDYFKNIKFGKALSLILTSILFTIAHIYWSPNLATLAFVFIASLLYGGVYMTYGKIESAILCHFLLNLIHMTFFSYHAM
jgi:uncharacterized protein